MIAAIASGVERLRSVSSSRSRNAAAVVTRVKPVEEGGPRATQMQHAGWRWREARDDAHLRSHPRRIALRLATDRNGRAFSISPGGRRQAAEEERRSPLSPPPDHGAMCSARLLRQVHAMERQTGLVAVGTLSERAGNDLALNTLRACATQVRAAAASNNCLPGHPVGGFAVNAPSGRRCRSGGIPLIPLIPLNPVESRLKLTHARIERDAGGAPAC